jgi:serine/threonine-protein kinase
MAGRGATIQTTEQETGELIAGKYRVERVIGEGGMGTVYAAYHQLLDVRVAVKVLSAELSEQPGIIARFLREARAVARLKSEHVARVSDIGMHEGQPFIVMELLEGEDLDKRLERGALPIADACDFTLQALEAMAHAHAIGIVHRDLKPANLFVATSPDGREVVKVLDFGIAKLTSAAQAEGGRTGGGITGEHALGSPSYMAPEQVRVLPQIDRRADLWALGAILYELVTGRTAFDGGSVGEIFGAVLHAAPTPMRELRPDTPPELVAVVERCLRRDVEERFTDAAEMARAIAPLASSMWQGHVSRIEQTLARAGKGSDPEGLRPSKLGLEQAALEAFGAEPGSGPRSVRRPLLSSRPAPAASTPDLNRTADELPAPIGSSTPPPVASTPPPAPRRSRTLMLPLAGVFGGCLVLVLVLRSLHGGSTAEAPKAAAAVSPAPPPAAQDHPPVPAEDRVVQKAADTSPPPADSTPSAAAPTAPQPSSSTNAHKRAVPAKAPAAATPHGKDLPGVLRSPD